MRIDVDWDRCDGNGVCAIEAPTVFEMTDDDELVVLHEEIADDEQAAVESAVSVCPKRALSLKA